MKWYHVILFGFLVILLGFSFTEQEVAVACHDTPTNTATATFTPTVPTSTPPPRPSRTPTVKPSRTPTATWPVWTHVPSETPSCECVRVCPCYSEYTVLRDEDLNNLIVEVNYAMGYGWIPSGNVEYIGVMFLQAMVRCDQ